jgi:hypothetical protein
MLPIRHSSIFRSRWWALLWAGGICWSAIAFVSPSSDDDGANATSTNATTAGDDADMQHLQALVAELQQTQRQH